MAQFGRAFFSRWPSRQAVAAVVPTQTIRPTSDVDAGAWTAAPLFSKVNDQSDATLISSPVAPGADSTAKLALGGAALPVAGDVTLHVRYRRS